MKRPFGGTQGGPRVQKWVSDTYLVNIGHCSHYVVYGTKFGAVQDFQKGKKSSLGVQQTGLEILYILGTPFRAKKNSGAKKNKKKEMKRGERERKEKRGERE